MTQLNVPLGIAIPQVFLDQPVDMKLVQNFAKRAEELDYQPGFPRSSHLSWI